MFLHELISSFDPRINLRPIENVELQGVCEDSRLVQPGDLFIARPGTSTDGMRFVSDAVGKGAVAVAASGKAADCAVPVVPIGDLAAAASRLANLFHGQPSQRVRVLGITGTNGKTTSAYLIRHLLGKSNIRCGMIGTVEIDDGKTRRNAEMTTPGAVEIAGLLARMRDNGCLACAMETSSHALDQGRVAGVDFAGAAFTNLTGDHLDYHKTMQQYARAKARLFQMLPEEAVALVNSKDRWSGKIVAECRARVMRFGFAKDCDYRARDVSITSQGSHFILETPDGQAEVAMQLIGKHNVLNALTAASLVGEVFGMTAQKIATGLRDAEGAPGRLQAVRSGQPFTVLVDYAHTDDAMANVLSALRPLTRGKLRVLFGCGGDRDPFKRPRMARTAAKLADAVYVTSDNPRTEDPQAIIEQILDGFPAAAAPAMVEADRRAAIEKILADAESGDVVLLAGKGHEDYQIIGKTKHHFDDVEEAGRVLAGRAWAA